MSALRMTVAEFDAHLARLKASAPAPVVRVTPKVVEPVAAPQTSLQRMQALGRLKQGEMNKTEAAYAGVLEKRKRAGEIQWYAFEIVTIKLADDTRYTPDFCVLLANGELEFHEVKGYWQDDSKVKIKVAAAMFPARFWAVFKQTKKDGGGFRMEAF